MLQKPKLTSKRGKDIRVAERGGFERFTAQFTPDISDKLLELSQIANVSRVVMLEYLISVAKVPEIERAARDGKIIPRPIGRAKKFFHS